MTIRWVTNYSAENSGLETWLQVESLQNSSPRPNLTLTSSVPHAEGEAENRCHWIPGSPAPGRL